MEYATEEQVRHYIDDSELKEVLAKHKKWLQSKTGREGEMAFLEGRCFSLPDQPGRDLSNINLRGANLRGAEFGNVKLNGANLREADLTASQFENSANLQMTDFRDSVLSGVNFAESNVKNAKFRGARLDDANLGSVENLLPMQLATTDLTRTKLPENACDFPGIAQVNKITYLGRSTFLMLLTASIFALFVVGTTEDVELLSGGVAETLPIINLELPLIQFIHVAPMFVLALYLYLTLYLVSLMNELSILPAIFPDGRTLDQHVEPWVLTSLMYKEIPNLDGHRPSLSYLRQYGAIVSGWWTAPIILVLVWWYYIRAHELGSSIFHVVLVVASIFLGICTFRIAKSNLRGKYQFDSLETRRNIKNPYLLPVIGLFAGLVAAVGLTYRAIETPQSIQNKSNIDILQNVRFYLDQSRFLDISGADVTTKPVVWSDPLKYAQKDDYEKLVNRESSNTIANDQTSMVEELRSWREEYYNFIYEALGSSGVNTVDLSERDLRHVNGSGAFLAMADIKYSNLSGARLEKADFRGALMNDIIAPRAKFTYSNMQGVVLSNAKLQGVDMQDVDLTGAAMNGAKLAPFIAANENTSNNVADLTRAVMRHTDLSHADLNKATMVEVDLRYATLIETNLVDALLPSADISHAALLGADMQRSKLPQAIMIKANLSPFVGFKIDSDGAMIDISKETNLQGADLSRADLTGAILTKVNFTNTKLAGAILRGADLTGATGLTQEQLDQACSDDNTVLPVGFKIKACE